MSVDVVTFGCRLNAYEAEVIREQAQAAGLADTVVVNTCAVTAEAVRQSRQAIRRLRRERPHALPRGPDVAAHLADDAAVLAEPLVGEGLVPQHHFLALVEETDGPRGHQQLHVHAAALGQRPLAPA